MTDDLLNFLGYKENFSSHIILLVLCVSVTTVFAVLIAIPQYLQLFSIKETFLFHLFVWTIWFIWLGSIFPISQRSLPKAVNEQQARYKKTFYSQILPGVSFLVALMTRPFSFALFSEFDQNISLLWYIPGILITSIGFIILYKAFIVIGTARAAFVFEYIENDKPLAISGIYKYIRHPIILGIGLGALGITLLFQNMEALYLALTNLGLLYIYNILEDRRLSIVFGNQFLEYRSCVSAFIPHINAFKNVFLQIIEKSRSRI